MLSAAVLLLAKATLLLVGALAVTRGLSRAPAGARHLVWLAALAALLLVPAIATWVPLRLALLPPVPAVARATAAAHSAAPVTRAPPAATTGVAPAGARATRADADARPAALSEPPAGRGAVRLARRVVRRVLSDPVRLGFALWAAVALAVGGSLVRAWSAVRRIVSRARPLDAPAWRDPLWEVADRLGLAEPPRLLRSEDARMPFACGLARPTIVLPAASDGWTLDRRRAVLLHELAHVRRRDLVGHTLARVVCALYWFHPLVWAAAKRLRAESERACDDVALACGARAADYAEHLLEIVTSVRRDATPAVALAMARRTEFEGRVLDILDAERPRHPASRGQLAALAGALALVTLVVGAVAPAAADAVHPGVGARAVDAPRGPARTDSAALKPAARPRPEPRVVGEAVEDTAEDADVAPHVAPQAPANERRSGASAERGDGPEDGRAVLLARVLHGDASAAVRRDAAWSLAGYPADPAAVVALAGALRSDRDGAVREMAAWGLAGGDTRRSDGGAGAASGAAAGALTAALRADPDSGVRATAAWALGTLGAGDSRDAVRDAAGALAPAPVPALVAALNDASPAVRTRAAWALGTLGEARTLRRAPDALVARLGDGDAAVRALAAWALFAVSDPAAVPALDRALRAERDAAVRQADVRALGAFGARAADALRPLLDAPDPQLRAAAVRALAGGDAAAFWPWPWPRPRPYPAYRADRVPLYLIR